MSNNGSSKNESSPSGTALSVAPVRNGHPSLQDEIDSLRAHMRWLQGALASSDSLEERIKLGRAYQESGYCLARLLHTQHLLHRGADTEFDQALNQVIDEITTEWNRS